MKFKIYLLCYIPFSFELCMHSLGTYKISSTKSVYSPKKALRTVNFALFNTHTTRLFKNRNILNFVDIINIESYIFINDRFNKDSFSIFSENFRLVLPRTQTILDQLEIVYYLFQILTQTDLGENQLSIQPLSIVHIYLYIYIYIYIYIYRERERKRKKEHMIELSICDVCNMPIATLNLLYIFLFLLPYFSFFLCHVIFFIF